MHPIQFLRHAVANIHFDPITIFGLIAVTSMLIFYSVEEFAPFFSLCFAASCFMGSTYGFLQGAWPFGLIEGIWGIVAVRKWLRRRNSIKHPFESIKNADAS